jgi:hypothetical protein
MMDESVGAARSTLHPAASATLRWISLFLLRFFFKFPTVVPRISFPIRDVCKIHWIGGSKLQNNILRR